MNKLHVAEPLHAVASNNFKKQRVPAKGERGFANNAQQEKIIHPLRSGLKLRVEFSFAPEAHLPPVETIDIQLKKWQHIETQMLPSHPPTFLVNHAGVHSRCKDTLKKSDIKIQSYESLDRIAEPLQIYCEHCHEDFTATTIDVWMNVNLSVRELFFEVPIAEFFSQWSKLEVE